MTQESAAEGMAGAVKARAPALAREADVAAAFVAVLAACRDQIAGNARAAAEEVRADDFAEVVHQARVGLRRLRAALAIFARALLTEDFGDVRARAKAIATALGEARALDVFAERLKRQSDDDGSPADTDAEALHTRALSERDAARASARTVLQSDMMKRFIADLDALITRQSQATEEQADEARRPARAFARDALNRLERRAHRRGRHFDDLDAEGLHELRIALKNLRYGADFFEALFDADAARAFSRSVARLQDRLGDFNDAVDAPALAQALGGAGVDDVTLASARAAATAREPLRKAWRSFRDMPRFWEPQRR